MIWSICQQNKPPKKFKIFEQIAKWNENHLNTDIQVNILSVAHPQLNPIEMLWNWLKTDVVKKKM